MAIYTPIPSNEIETWKQVPGYPFYYASSLGQFKNENGNFLQQNIVKSGYLHVTLYNDGIPKTFRTHRLIAKMFIENPENKEQVNHKNGIKTDNRASQLEWATMSENQLHSYSTGLNIPKRGEKHPGYGKFRGNSFRAKVVLHLPTGVFYDCAKDAADSIDMKYSSFKSGLRLRNGRAKDFIYA